MNARGKITAPSGKVTTMTSREFNRELGRAKAAADVGPVVITDRGRPAYVLMSSDEHDRLIGKRSFASILESPADTSREGDFPYDFERVRGGIREVDLGEDSRERDRLALRSPAPAVPRHRASVPSTPRPAHPPGPASAHR